MQSIQTDFCVIKTHFCDEIESETLFLDIFNCAFAEKRSALFFLQCGLLVCLVIVVQPVLVLVLLLLHTKKFAFFHSSSLSLFQSFSHSLYRLSSVLWYRALVTYNIM